MPQAGRTSSVVAERLHVLRLSRSHSRFATAVSESWEKNSDCAAAAPSSRLAAR